MNRLRSRLALPASRFPLDASGGSRIEGFILLCFLLLISSLQLEAYDREAWTSFPNMNSVTAFAEGETQIFVGTTGGIRRYDRFYDRWLPPLTTLDGLLDNRILALAYDPVTGDLWFDTPVGSARWLSRLETVSLIADRPPGRRPAAVPALFLPYGYHQEERWIRGQYRSYPITDTLIDSWHKVWLGTDGLGVGLADLGDRQLAFHQFGPLSENITAIAEDGEHLWFGGWDSARGRARGISRFSPATDQWDYFDSEDILGLDDPRITSILVDTSSVWFGTPAGLTRYSKNKNLWQTFRLPRRANLTIRALARSAHRIWLGTDRGLVVLDTRGDSLRIVQGSEQFQIRDLATGPDFIWAATDLGLYHCPLGDVVWTAVPLPNDLSGVRTNGVHASSFGVWASVEAPGALIGKRRGETEWQRHALSEAYGAPRIAIFADTSNVWVGTELGAFRLDLGTDLQTRYTRLDGLLSNRVQALLLRGEMIWFGTAEGLTRYRWGLDIYERNR